MDTVGNYVWKWYGETVSDGGGNSGRSSSWTGVDQFASYVQNNTGYGLVAGMEQHYLTGEQGDLILMGTQGDWRYAVFISNVVQDKEEKTIDYLVHSNTGNLENDPASLYGYPEFALVKIAGRNS